MIFNKNGYLDAGFHDHDANSIKTHLVDAFPTSVTRSNIWDGYIRHSDDIRKCGVQVVEFFNGSFSTTKNDPGDIDLVGFADEGAVNSLPPPLQALFQSLFLGPNTKTSHLCDAYFVATVPPGHPQESRVRTMRKYWMGEFGYDRSDIPKGIIRTIVK